MPAQTAVAAVSIFCTSFSYVLVVVFLMIARLCGSPVLDGPQTFLALLLWKGRLGGFSLSFFFTWKGRFQHFWLSEHHLWGAHHFSSNMKTYKVNRRLARYSPRTATTNQPTNRAPNEPARPMCAQENIFWGKNGRFRAMHPNFMGGCKSYGTQI